MSFHLQPPLHDLVSVIKAPCVALSAANGQVRAGDVTGFYGADRRVLSVLEVEVDGALLTPVGQRAEGAAAGHLFSALVRLADDVCADAPLVLHRRRIAHADRFEEVLELENFGLVPAVVQMRVRVATDLAPVHVVRGGEAVAALVPQIAAGRLRWTDAEGDEVELTSQPHPGAVYRGGGDAAELEFPLNVPPGEARSVSLVVTAGLGGSAADEQPPFLPATVDRLRPASHVRPGDRRLARLLDQSLEDLGGLLLADPRRPADHFLAAGSPWYFTLFGRDALWSAQLLLPHSVDLAADTLRVLARRQGTAFNPDADEQPGKILHEVRRQTLRLGEMVIPPLYYGSIDATTLWIRLLHAAWRAGMPDGEVAQLLPNLRSALDWIITLGDSDGDGFVEYRRRAPGGLANQGWKDTPQAVRWADGRIAQAPLALCEAQGYAYAAAVRGADLLEAFGEGSGERWRHWAEGLRARFRSRFWLVDEVGPYPAIALDCNKRPVDGAASNMAHLLDTGLLEPHESAHIARRLAAPDLDCGYGLRTLSSSSRAFNPLSYHCGSVWPHDTAIAVLGLAAEGHHMVAQSLAQGVLTAAEHFDYRLPELYGGTDGRRGEAVLAYPTACRPQAWAAAGAVALAGYLQRQELHGAVADTPDGDRGQSAARPE